MKVRPNTTAAFQRNINNIGRGAIRPADARSLEVVTGLIEKRSAAFQPHIEAFIRGHLPQRYGPGFANIDPIWGLTHYLYSLLDICPTYHETRSGVRRFNQSLIKRLAYVIEPEAMATLLMCGTKIAPAIGLHLEFPYLSKGLDQALQALATESKPAYQRAKILHADQLDQGEADDLNSQGLEVSSSVKSEGLFLVKMPPLDKTTYGSIERSVICGGGDEWVWGLERLVKLVADQK